MIPFMPDSFAYDLYQQQVDTVTTIAVLPYNFMMVLRRSWSVINDMRL